MLIYQVLGPDADGIYSLAYPTPGAPHVLTLAGDSRSKTLADEECARLNELQAVDRRAAIRERADRIVSDLAAAEKGAD